MLIEGMILIEMRVMKMDNTYSNLGTAEMWKNKKAILDSTSTTSIINSSVQSDNIQKLNAQHGNYLNNSLKKIEESLEKVRKANEKYESLSSAVDNVIRLIEKSEQNGFVQSDASLNQYHTSESTSSSLKSNFMNDVVREDAVNINEIPSSSLTSSTMNEQDTSTKAMTNDVLGDSINSSHLDSNNYSQAISSSNVNQFQSSSNSLNSIDVKSSQAIGSDIWGGFSNTDQVNIIMKLQVVGYSQEEIKKIINGKFDVATIEVDALKNSLEELISTHPELRNEIIDIYGFDIFNEDGSIDNNKLILTLIIDQKDENDDYSLIDFIHSKYGIEIINQEQYDIIVSIINNLIVKYPNIQNDIILHYGFDIFNKDMTINKNKLSVIILMDNAIDNDEYDLIKYLSKYKKQENFEKIKGVKTLSGVNLLGVIERNNSFLFNNNISEKNK